jgi:hypothetical protein
MTAIEKLDATLKEISKDYKGVIMQDLHARLATTYHTKINENDIQGIITGNELERIILKLLDDKYISSISKALSSTAYATSIEHFFTTFDGNLLIQTGGYAKKIEREKDAAFYEKVKSWAIVVGTVLAGLYALWQFFDSIAHKCPCHGG